MALFDKMFNGNEKERKLKQEIDGLRLRKESVLSAINGEIVRLQEKRKGIMLEAGVAAYEAWSQGNPQVDLVKFWEQINGLDEQIAAQQVKKTEMITRYDEEIRLISNGINVGYTEEETSMSESNCCSKCGNVVRAEDVFCQNCGNRIRN